MTARSIPHLLLVLLLTLPWVAGQEPKKLLTSSEVKSLAKTLVALQAIDRRDQRQEKELEKQEEALAKQLEKLEKKHGTELLTETASWTEVFYLQNEELKAKNPAGLGRPTSAKVAWGRGDANGAEYHVILPKGYKRGDAWPLIVCLPPMDEKGESQDSRNYLQDTWMDKEVDDELRDKFIIMAPTIGERVLGPRGDRINRRKIDDLAHLQTIGNCLTDVLTNYKVDVDRVYLDGTGQGGTSAVDLAIALPYRFAAVVTRGGVPGAISDLRNLSGLAPVMIVHREGDEFTADNGARKTQLDKAAQEYQLAMEWKTLPPFEKNGTDNYVEATNDVARFLDGKVRNCWTPNLYYATRNIRLFKRSTWVRFDVANASPEDGSSAWVQAKVNAEENSIAITCQNVESMRVYLNQQLVDLSRPIKVTVNGKLLNEEQVEPSVDYLLDFAAANYLDPAQVVVGHLRLNVPLPEKEEGEGDR